MPAPAPVLIFWDSETSGLKPGRDRITELAAIVEYDDGSATEHQWLLNHPGLVLSPEIVQLTGITPELLASEGIDPRRALSEFLGLWGPQRVANCTHNGLKFDIPFFLAEAHALLGLTLTELTALTRQLADDALDTAVFFKARRLGLKPGDRESFERFGARVIETRALGLKYSLGVCCEYHGVDISDVRQHRALGDVTATRRLWKKLVATRPVA